MPLPNSESSANLQQLLHYRAAYPLKPPGNDALRASVGTKFQLATAPFGNASVADHFRVFSKITRGDPDFAPYLAS